MLHRDPASKPSYPKYKIVSAHEIVGCEGYPPPAVNVEQQRTLTLLAGGWIEVPKSISTKAPTEYQRWGSFFPRGIAEHLVRLGHAELNSDRKRFRAIPYDAEAAARPDWIWLPNALVDGADGEVPPVELVRQTGSGLTLCLLVNLYAAQALDENGGIHWRRIRQDYARLKVGEQGAFIVWGFVPGSTQVWPDAVFAAPHFAAVNDETGRKAAWEEFWECWGRLRSLGLVEFVGHLVDADTAEGEIMYPVALPGTGLPIEQELGRAAREAGRRMVTSGQWDWAISQEVAMLAPVRRHVEGVQMLGIARLRYHPRTNRTCAFLAREEEWQETLERLQTAGADALATSREDQGTSRSHQRNLGGNTITLRPSGGVQTW
ncbi:MAG: hypothetical protein ACRYG8_06015 [Janthinobacterium lividum]